MSDDDTARQFAAAIVDSRYRPRKHQPEPTLPDHWTDEARRQHQLSQMLHEALNPTQPEPNWRQLFSTGSDLANDLFRRTDEQPEGK